MSHESLTEREQVKHGQPPVDPTCMYDNTPTQGPVIADGTRLKSSRSAAVPPRLFSYMRFAGFSVGVLGATIGETHDGQARRVVWSLTCMLAVSLVSVGEWKVWQWRKRFDSQASPQLRAERTVLKAVNRRQVLLVIASIAAFIIVLIIPVSPNVRRVIFLAFLSGISLATRLIGRLRASRSAT